ncbi:MAG: hypothetical protein SAK29_08750 [Scytonema sp. PMC 1069.18]|nr:hypothetical protein [Scytonema sp. PMC 1069.18]
MKLLEATAMPPMKRLRSSLVRYKEQQMQSHQADEQFGPVRYIKMRKLQHNIHLFRTTNTCCRRPQLHLNVSLLSHSSSSGGWLLIQNLSTPVPEFSITHCSIIVFISI